MSDISARLTRFARRRAAMGRAKRPTRPEVVRALRDAMSASEAETLDRANEILSNVVASPPGAHRTTLLVADERDWPDLLAAGEPTVRRITELPLTDDEIQELLAAKRARREL